MKTGNWFDRWKRRNPRVLSHACATATATAIAKDLFSLGWARYGVGQDCWLLLHCKWPFQLPIDDIIYSHSFSDLLVSLPLTIILPSLVMKQSIFAAKTLPNVDSNGTMEAILKTLGAESLECQQRLICDVIESPKTFRPLSDIIYLMLRYVILYCYPPHLLLLLLPSKRGFHSVWIHTLLPQLACKR